MKYFDLIIYAVGGGHGHAVRGALLAERFSPLGSTLLCIRKDALVGIQGLKHIPSCLEIVSDNEIAEFSAPQIIVDTFPRGWFDELSDTYLATFSKRIFVARYRKAIDWKLIEQLYDEIWLPYPASDNEWEQFPVYARCVGTLIKRGPTFTPSKNICVVYDPERRCSEGFLNRLEEILNRNGLILEYRVRLSDGMAVERILAVGAGYNTYYELRESGENVRFIPIKKRFDDQDWRARRHSLAVSSFNEIEEWVTTTGNV